MRAGPGARTARVQLPGLAAGLAVKDSLSNISAGVLLILFQPFKVGDYIEAAGNAGVVEYIQVFSTILRTGDNRENTVANGAIFRGTTVNVTARATRRVDMVFCVGYDDDIAKAREPINQVMADEERILKDPAPAVSVVELAENSVDLNVGLWFNSGDYRAVRSGLLERIKGAFDSNGISIPFPQRDVHLYPQGSEAA
ncbi:MAG: mechanosensitive ion channel domain-containing protein [Gammaproteobacteria bacterium]